jgi:hypothetical protein
MRLGMSWGISPLLLVIILAPLDIYFAEFSLVSSFVVLFLISMFFSTDRRDMIVVSIFGITVPPIRLYSSVVSPEKVQVSAIGRLSPEKSSAPTIMTTRVPLLGELSEYAPVHLPI